MSGAAAGGFATGFAGGVNQGLSLGFTMQQRELAERKEKLDELELVTKTMEKAQKDPAAIPALQEVMTNLKVPQEKQKSWIQQIKTGQETTVNNFISELRKYGMEKDAPSIRTILQMSEVEKMNWLEKRLELRSQAETTAALAEASGGQPTLASTQQAAAPVTGAPPTQGAVATPPAAARPATTGAPPAATVPSSAAPTPGGGTVGPQQNVQPVSTGLTGASPKEQAAFNGTAQPKGVDLPKPVGIMGQDGKTMPLTTQQIAPIASVVKRAQEYQTAAETLRKKGNVKGVEAMEKRIKDLESSANVMLTPAQTRALGYEQGAVVSYNVLTNSYKTEQAGYETERVLRGDEAKRVLGENWKPGDIVKQTSRGKTEFLRQGEDQWQVVPSELTKDTGLPPGQAYQRKVSPGSSLDPMQPGGKIEPIGSGITSERKASQLEQERTNKILETSQTASAAADKRGTSWQIMLRTSQDRKTGIEAGVRIIGSKLLDLIGMTELSKEVGGGKLEVLAANQDSIATAYTDLLKGNTSDRDLGVIRGMAGTIYNSPESLEVLARLGMHADANAKLKYREQVKWNRENGSLEQLNKEGVSFDEYWDKKMEENSFFDDPKNKDALQKLESVGKMVDYDGSKRPKDMTLNELTRLNPASLGDDTELAKEAQTRYRQLIQESQERRK